MMMRRVPSESRRPGMQGSRCCDECGLPLGNDYHCIICEPVLNPQAKAAGEARRRDRAALEHACRQIENTDAMIRRLQRRLK